LTERETLDHLAGEWKIYQLKGGYRFSTDDVLAAWTAYHAKPKAERMLDLGSGIGSVGFLTLFRLPAHARLLGIEVQPVSHSLALRTAELNRLSGRVEFRLGDLRDESVLDDAGLFPLITGSPPYFTPGKATLSPHPQRAAARVELHGDIFDYCRRAAAHLEPQGRFAFIHVASDPRPVEAVTRAGLRLLRAQEVYFRRIIPPAVTLYLCGHEGDRERTEPFVIRDRSGLWTQQYLDMRREMGTVLRNPD
jgi:tRNA1Val (adenine37-N6)-methyltransferase